MSNTQQSKQMPRDALVIINLLKEMGITSYEPRVINQMLEFVYRYVTNVIEEARHYSTYAKKKTIDVDDVKIAIKMISEKSYSVVPPRELLLDIAKSKNIQPLPLLKSTSGLRLPPDRFCLTQPNYQLQFYKRAIAPTTTTTPQVIRTQANVFKTPTAPMTANAASPSTSTMTARTLIGTPQPFRVTLADPSTSGGQQIIQYNPGSSGSGAPTPTIRVISQAQNSIIPNAQGLQIQGVKRKFPEDDDPSPFN